MAHWKFGDLVREVKSKVDRANNLYEYYVAGDHMDSEDITIRRKGCFATDDVGPAFIREFKKGQILYGSRRTYLKKVAMADFDGVTSNVTFVLESKDERNMLQKLLPFIMLSDGFTQWSISKSKGSTNPYVLFSDLIDYELELPSMSKQQELADVLWSIKYTIDAYRALLNKSNELVKSQFIEMFGDVTINDKNWKTARLENVASSRLGKMLDSKKQTSERRYPYLANFNVRWFGFDVTELNKMTFSPEETQEFNLQNGDLLVCEGGEVGRCAVWHNDVPDCYFQKALHRVRCNRTIILPDYLAWWFKINCEKQVLAHIAGAKATIAHLPSVKLKQLQIVIPPLTLQSRFVAFLKQVDKSKFGDASKFVERLKVELLMKVFL